VVADEPSAGVRDLKSLDAVYARYHRRLFAFLYRTAGAREPAEDLFQESWLRIARGWTTLPADADLEAWLFTVARNVFVSRYRARLVERRALDRLAQVPGAAPSPPDRLVESSHQIDALGAAFTSLSHDDRAILWLVAVEDMEQAQVAQVLDLSYSALRQRLARARSRLAAALAEIDRARAPNPRSGSCP
jgi:RNA polymerase sigma-70 factor (ECF subfamily)